MGRAGRVLVYEFSLHVLWTFVQNLQFKSPGSNTLMTYVHDANMVAVKIHHASPHLHSWLEVCRKRSVTSMGRSKMRSHGNFPIMSFQDIFNLTDIDEGVPCQPPRQVGPNKDLSLGYAVRIRFLISIGLKSKQIIFKKHHWNLLCYDCIACKLYVNIWLTHEEYTLYITVMMILAFSSFSNKDVFIRVTCKVATNWLYWTTVSSKLGTKWEEHENSRQERKSGD